MPLFHEKVHNMVPSDLGEFARGAVALYERKLRRQLEANHPNQFVAVEPVSGDFYLGNTLSEALGAAREAHPDRLAHAIRVGHPAALHFGVNLR